MKVCFIGFGNMATAIAKGLTDQNDLDIHACSPSLTEGARVNNVTMHKDNHQGSKEADIIILAVKPPKILSVLQELSIHKDTLIISVAAAIPIDSISAALPPGTAVVRAMPNTPIAVGAGATPLVANANCKPRHIKAAERIFADNGIVEWVEESQLEAFAPLSGSGPAYVFLFLEALTAAGVELGLEENLCKRFAQQTLQGALRLCETSPESFATLRQQVTSPGGTTAAALAIFAKNNFKSMVTDALKEAHNRAIELREELGPVDN